jgi:hypothetical protein
VDRSRTQLLAPCILLGAVAGALAIWLASRPADGDAPAPAGVAPREAAPPAPPAAGALPPANTAAPAGAARRLRLPDGSEAAPLNGVLAPAAMVWGERPYAQIVGVERGNGVDWWVHADGTRSTTLEIWRHELGRTDPVTLVFHPGEPAPVDAGGAAPAPVKPASR